MVQYATVRSLRAVQHYYAHPIGLLADDSFGNLICVPEFLLYSWYTWDEDMLRYS